ncbi:HNH endonuclease [Pseudomonas wadenswilerensis]|jgi:5-methylcytosine-specific restriction endonuclease McrA|uniref:HNH domain-containing protein n=1 Tax=Pseudomonas wadenswilerensis TaxID=1785161 RepID=A0A380SZD7_9PSED|nr:HNH endonuclease [Pseudomonas wadenswilerensis]SUQ62944.1 hypothetical protein CCOS864_02394 [Pseudomonas wadenswilerensis]
MRPILKPTSHAHYLLPQSLDFGGAVSGLLQQVVAIKAPTAMYRVSLIYVLKLLLKHSRGLKLSNLTPMQQDALITGLKQRVAQIYKTAAAPLAQELGAFCAYCGTALPGLVEVEHAVPKAHYPMFATSWENFLPACSPCNTAKGNTPDRIKAARSTGIHAPGEQDLRNAIRRRNYIWPDLAADSWQRFPNKLRYHDPARPGWVELNIQDSVASGNQLIAYDVIQHQVLADLMVNNILLSNVQVAVFVDCDPHDAVAVETIDLIGFNDDSPGTYDRRQMNRTRAWFDALEECRLLLQANGPLARDQLWENTPRRAASSGFYAVWLSVMSAFDATYGCRYASRFVLATKDPLYYPGTNTQQLP